MVTTDFPKHEMYGLSNQVRRAAVSVPSNVAEGFCRKSSREFIRYLDIACGSLAVVETQLMVSHRLHYIVDSTFGILMDMTSKIGKMLYGLRLSINKRSSRDS